MARNQEMGFPWSSYELGNGFADCWALPEISGYKFALHVRKESLGTSGSMGEGVLSSCGSACL